MDNLSRNIFAPPYPVPVILWARYRGNLLFLLAFLDRTRGGENRLPQPPAP